MATSIIHPKYVTVADILAKIGDVPPERIRLDPRPGTATEKDLLKLMHRPTACMNWWMACSWRSPWD